MTDTINATSVNEETSAPNEEVTDIKTVEPVDAGTEPVVADGRDGIQDNEVLKNLTSDFIDDSDVDMFKLMSAKTKINDLTALANNIKAEQDKLINSSEDFVEYLDTVIDDYDEETLKNLTNSEIDVIYTFNGDPMEFGIPFDTKKEEYEFKKDYLVMRKQTKDAVTKLDADIAALNADLAEHQGELNHLMDEYSDMDGLIRAKLKTKYDTTDDEHVKKLYADLIAAFDNASTLDNIIAYVKSYKGRSIISDYRDAKKSNKVYKHYLAVSKSLDVTTNLTIFRDLEKKFLSVDDNNMYVKRPNVFVFTIIHYISSLYNKDYTKAEGLFITQLIINLKNLYYDKFTTPEKKESFIEKIKTVIDIIG